jgi:RNA polymerase sigma-70 factor (ECF subfamily)
MKIESAAAIRASYRDYGRSVYAVAYRVLGRADLAEEATQQAFVHAGFAAEEFGAGRDLAARLRTAARDVAIDMSRRESRRELERPGAETTEVRRDELDATWRVRQAIDALSADEATIVRLQHLEGLTDREIAEVLDLPLDTIASRSQDAHDRLLSSLRGTARTRDGVAVPVAFELSAAVPPS